MKYNFDEIIDRYNTGSAKYDRIKEIYPMANKDSIIMTIADMDFRCAPEVIEGMKKIAEDGIYAYMTEYFKPFHDSIISWWKNNHNLEVKEDELIYANGTVEIIKAIIKMFTKENEYVALSRPVYGHFTYSIETELKRHVKDIHLILDEDGYHMDFNKLREELKDVKIYILCSPHNPIGRVWNLEELKELVKICKETNTLLISDEVHSDLIRKGLKFYPIYATGETKNIVMLTNPGKTFNMSGLQCCTAIVKDKDLYNKIRENFDASITTFGLWGATLAYTKGQKWKDELNLYIDETIDIALDYIKKEMPYVDVIKPEGTYFLWLDFKRTSKSSAEIHHLIYDIANVFLQDGVEHDPLYGGTYQRMPVGFPRSIVLEALRRIKEAFEE